MQADRPIEVAVIGSGCASISAAFELTRPQHRGKYSSHGLSDRLAARRQGRFGPRPGRPHRGARPARLARLLRERVPAAARVLCRARPRSAHVPLRRLARRVLSRSLRRHGAAVRRWLVELERAFPACRRLAGRSAHDAQSIHDRQLSRARGRSTAYFARWRANTPAIHRRCQKQAPRRPRVAHGRGRIGAKLDRRADRQRDALAQIRCAVDDRRHHRSAGDPRS